MKKAFMCSLCRGGTLGGALYLDEKSLAYKTGKLTVDPKYRNLVLPLDAIKAVSWRWIAATFDMQNGEHYTFLIFNKPRFQKFYGLYTN